MSDNSDKVAEKIVGKLITCALIGVGCFYLVRSFPWLIWVIILGGVLSILGVILFETVRAAWDQLTAPESTAGKVGKILMVLGAVGLAGGFLLLTVTGGAQRSGPPDEMSSYLIASGFLALLAGGVTALIVVRGHSSTSNGSGHSG